MRMSCSTSVFVAGNLFSCLRCTLITVITLVHVSLTCEWKKNESCMLYMLRLLRKQCGNPEEEVVDSDKLKNELSCMKLKLMQKEKEKKSLIEEKNTIMGKIIAVENNMKDIENSYKQEQTMNGSLRNQLKFFQAQQKSLEVEKGDCRRIKEKLTTLKDLETILKGCETEAQDIFERSSDSGSSIRQLSTYCAVLKREYEQIKSEKKMLKDHFDKVKRDLINKTQLLNSQEKEHSNLNDLVHRSEEDLKHVEKERDILRKKLTHLKRAIRSPCPAGSSSFVETLMEESPAQSTPVRLNRPKNGLDEIDLDCSDVIPATPEVIKTKPMTDMKRPLKENVTLVKISSASEQNPNKRVKREINDINIASSMGSFNIFKKQQTEYQSSVRKGYDGLGGHTTFAQPQWKPKPTLKKSFRGAKLLSKAGKLPQLPTLDDFAF
ncbi:hypothetical protein ScPMuIL_007598 [Solemya velum]